MAFNRTSDTDSRLYRRWNRRISNYRDRGARVTGMMRTSNHGCNKTVSTPDSSHDVSVESTDSDGSTDPDLHLFIKSFKNLGGLSINDDDYGGGNDDDVEFKAVEDHGDEDDAECNCDDEDDGDFDLDYAMCLKNLREFGTAYILAVTGNDGRSVRVKYEEDDDERCDELKRKSSKKVDVVAIPSKGKVNGLKRTHWRKIRSEAKIKSPSVQHQSPGPDPKVQSNRGRKKKSIEKEVKVEYMDTAVPGSGPKAHNLSGCKTKHVKRVFQEERQYTYFLNCLKLDGDSLLLETEYGDRIRYENDVESASDSDIEIATVPYLYNKPSKRIGSEFMEKLMDILTKSFDKYEYEELMHKISERKPLEKHRDLRNNPKSCIVLESVGKSYLDYFSDLKRRIDAVRSDRHKVLNLLRGFFYWLKNLSNNDAFRPWLDETCMKALPRR